MIDLKLFTVERLLSTLLDTRFGNHNKWWSLCEIIPDYKAPFAKPGDAKRYVVRCHGKDVYNIEHIMFLRYSAGPRQGFFWDTYGDDFQTAELALLALVQAPVPPVFIDLLIWKQS